MWADTASARVGSALVDLPDGAVLIMPSSLAPGHSSFPCGSRYCLCIAVVESSSAPSPCQLNTDSRVCFL